MIKSFETLTNELNQLITENELNKIALNKPVVSKVKKEKRIKLNIKKVIV